MPEGHTLHRLARELAELVRPAVSATSPQVRFDCGTPIVTGTVDGRTTYACPRCQPEWAG